MGSRERMREKVGRNKKNKNFKAPFNLSTCEVDKLNGLLAPSASYQKLVLSLGCANSPLLLVFPSRVLRELVPLEIAGLVLFKNKTKH